MGDENVDMDEEREASTIATLALYANGIRNKLLGIEENDNRSYDLLKSPDYPCGLRTDIY